MPRGRNNSPEVNRRAHLRYHYDISPEEYDVILAAQGGGCALCGVTVQPSGKRLAVDHNHETKVVRGILCYACNITLGRVEIVGVEKILEYLGWPALEDLGAS
jgi:hypothetical protein